MYKQTNEISIEVRVRNCGWAHVDLHNCLETDFI